MKKTLRQKWQTFTFSERFTAITSVGGIVVSIVGLTLVIISLKSSEKIASTSTYLQTYAWTIDVDKAFIEHPEAKGYLYEDIAKLKSNSKYKQDKAQLDVILELMLDSYDAILNNTSYFKIYPDQYQIWMKTVKDNFKRSAVLRMKFEMDSDEYSSLLDQAYKHRLDRK
ncbi:hypothetical protein ACFFGT_13235 [Mucilaginibacter angelicae]|uniref:Chemotaxis methyl-accepting receptor HlyB-like 4HB MCP domain-containing protein n=1 Tax=Mucilaginibacter angelicae TaxID=869718 RepID=A0ABV6L6U9_9SPHI